MKIKDLIKPIEAFAPLSYQESYDNAGLIVGKYDTNVDSALICLDITEEIIDEAIEQKAGIIISHHPIIFGGLKRLNGNTLVERCVIKAIKNDIALYAAHTNLDAVEHGVSAKLAERIGLKNIKMLKGMPNELLKLSVFVPLSHTEAVASALFEQGAGHIGNYDCCSFSVEGTGTFRGDENTNPYAGKKLVLHSEPEKRIEVVLPKAKKAQVVHALLSAHPYEEVAYDLYPIENMYNKAGIGAIGTLPEPEDELSFLEQVKVLLGNGVIRHSELRGKPIQKVALCGGSGSFLIQAAKSQRADLFITADIKYHDFFLAEQKIILADVGHFESEQFTCEIFRDILMKNFPTFALHLSEHSKNPIQYL